LLRVFKSLQYRVATLVDFTVQSILGVQRPIATKLVVELVAIDTLAKLGLAPPTGSRM
jgi:hypothetical protein